LIRPEPDVIKALAIMARQHPQALEWLEGWLNHELKQLPNVTQNVSLAQGRCQVLKEIYTVIKESPDNTAKS
jgi:iron-sulfur cluster repair protein YtfE (RIC family)